jgi:hypothetical protein
VHPGKLLLFCCGALLLAGGPAPGSGDDPGTGFTAGSPVLHFRVSTFTRDGFRAWLLAGTEGRYISANELQISGLNLTVFDGTAANRVESVFLSPSATALLNERRVEGPERLRLITDDFEASGEEWAYNQRQKRVSIGKNVRVVFHTQLQDMLR